ncbi:MAG: RusA family crossover junction endodeoxyribonuclease [Phycisphaeraceae bacterium]|nr:RusA family crossover junction endodeoxyribonuclease [Phycisphaeraceae bacterium]
MELSLPLPPSANHYYRRVGRATLISRAGREYRATVKAKLLTMGAPSVTGPLTVLVSVFPPDRRRRDLDNLLKCLLDSLQHGGLYRDDSMIDRIDIRRGPCTRGGGVHVKVHELTDATSRGAAREGQVW